MEFNKTSHVTIIGSGISGLSLAYYLKELNLSVSVLEKEKQTGGLISSEQVDSFDLDTGPQSFLSEPEMMKLLSDLKLSEHVIFPNPHSKKRFLAGKNTIEAFPTNPLQLIKSKVITPKDIYQILREIFTTHSKKEIEDISLYDLLSERFGASFTKRVLSAPFVGVWASSIEDLSARSTAYEIYKAYRDGNSIIKSLFTAAKKKKFLNAKSICSFKNGLKTLTLKLESALSDSIIKGAQIEKITLSNKIWEIKTSNGIYYTKHIVLALPSYEIQELLKIISGIDKESTTFTHFSENLDTIQYSPVGLMHVAVPKNQFPEKLKGFGFLRSPYESEGLLGCIFSSIIFPDKFHDDHVLLTCFCGGTIKPEFAEIDNPEIENALLNQLRALIGAHDCKVIKKSYRPKAIPLYKTNHYVFEETIQEFENTYTQLSIHSNISKGVSIPSRIKQSMILAAKIKFELNS